MSLHLHSSCRTIDTHGRPHALREAWLLSSGSVLSVIKLIDKRTHGGSYVGRVRVYVSILVTDRNTAILVHLTVVGLVAIAISIAIVEVVELILWTIQIPQFKQFVVPNSGIASHEAVAHAGAEGISHHVVASHGELCGIYGANVCA